MLAHKAIFPDMPIQARETRKPRSTRLDPADFTAIAAVRVFREEAVSFRSSMERSHTIFESELERFEDILRRAPTILQESADALHELAGVARRYFSEIERLSQQRRRTHVLSILDAIVETANERLRDVEGSHAARWIDNPYSLDSVRDLRGALTEIIEFLRTSNSLSQVPELEDASRRYLIDLCKTVIKLLEGPRIEVGLFDQCAKALKRLTPVIVSAAISGAVGSVVTNLMQTDACVADAQ